MKILNYFKSKYLLYLIVIQPVLDLVAYFFQHDNVTISGLFRLIIMIIFYIFTFKNNYKNKRFIIASAIVAIVFGLHILNCIRVGYLDFIHDISYLTKVVYLPVVTICLCANVKTEIQRDLILKGILIAFIITSLIILISFFTDSYTFTYDGNIGISGWVISDNRCSHSNILSAICVIAILFCVETKKVIIKYSFPIIVFALLFTNATRACYFTLILIMALYPLFLIVEHFAFKNEISRNNKVLCLLMVIICIVAVVLFPYSPRYKVSQRINNYLIGVEKDFASLMATKGYDVYSLKENEILSNDEVHDAYKDYYTRRVYGANLPMMIETYGPDRIMKKFDYTVSAITLEDSRIMNVAYASFIFEDSDLLTKLFGFEFTKLLDDSADVENDWFGIMYYYGYATILLYFCVIIYLFILEIKLFIISKKDFMSINNFSSGLIFTLQIALGYYSGAVLRRPNSSIYFACMISLIYFQSRKTEVMF